MSNEYSVAITGASGSSCARRLLRALAEHPEVGVVHTVMSSSAVMVAREELGPADAGVKDIRAEMSGGLAKVRWYEEGDFRAPIASGSHQFAGMAIVPCSTGTLGTIASGASRNLIHRAAEVCLKERRRLILGVRETPLSEIQITNMLAVTRAGAVVLPITPAFYSHPRNLDDVVELYVARVLDLLGLQHTLGRRWGS